MMGGPCDGMCRITALSGPLVAMLLLTAVPALTWGWTTRSNSDGSVDMTIPNCLYVHIGSFDISFDTSNHTLYPNIVSKNLGTNTSDVVVGHCSNAADNSITYTRYYDVKNGTGHLFNFTMIFKQDPTSTGDEWYMSGFKHRNFAATASHSLFEYSGVKNAITSSGDMGYFCNRVTFSGKAQDPEVESKVVFTNLHIQAFKLKGSTPSSNYRDCGENDSDNFTINLSIGLVVGGTVVLALIAILIILAARRIRRRVRGYNLLDS